MLATMYPELQKSFESLEEFEINGHLKETFQDQVRKERFKIIKSLMACKHIDGNSVCASSEDKVLH